MPRVRLSLVLDDATLTVGPSLIQRHVSKGRRRWGALCEHHVLVGLRDALEAEARVGAQHGSFPAAFLHWAAANDYGAVVAPTAPAVLPLYERRPGRAGVAPAGCTVHLLLPGAGAVDLATAEATCGAVLHRKRFVGRWALPAEQDAGAAVRAVVSLQGHNNCGRLWPAISSVLGGGEGGGQKAKGSEAAEGNRGNEPTVTKKKTMKKKRAVQLICTDLASRPAQLDVSPPHAERRDCWRFDRRRRLDPQPDAERRDCSSFDRRRRLDPRPQPDAERLHLKARPAVAWAKPHAKRASPALRGG